MVLDENVSTLGTDEYLLWLPNLKCLFVIPQLSMQDWKNVAYDLQTLGFIPEDAGDPVELGLVEPLGSILSQLSGGGGATKLNIDAVMGELEDLGKRYPFSIPPFFALILRAFSVIEGIALGVDPDYAIVQECFPYLSRRLLSDDNPRVRKALRDVLYGNKQRLDVDRLIRLADAFTSFTTDGLSADGSSPAVAVAAAAGPSSSRGTFSGSGSFSSSSRVQQGGGEVVVVEERAVVAAGAPSSSSSGSRLDPAVRDALVLVFSPRGSYVQVRLQRSTEFSREINAGWALRYHKHSFDVKLCFAACMTSIFFM